MLEEIKNDGGDFNGSQEDEDHAHFSMRRRSLSKKENFEGLSPEPASPLDDKLLGDDDKSDEEVEDFAEVIREPKQILKPNMNE